MSIWAFPKIRVPPNHPNLIGFSHINQPFWRIPIYGNLHMSYASPSPTYSLLSLGCFSKLGSHSTIGNQWAQNGWFRRENPIKMNSFGVPNFLETLGLSIFTPITSEISSSIQILHPLKIYSKVRRRQRAAWPAR